MNAQQDHMARKIDRAREQTTRPKISPARAMQIRMDARMDLRAALARYETPEEKVAYIENALDMAAEGLWPLTNRVDAMTAFNKRAADIGVFLKLPRAIAKARGDQELQKARRPANDWAANDDRGQG